MAERGNSNIWKVNLSNEYGSVGEKVAREWLKQNDYEAHSFQEIMFKTIMLNSMQKRGVNTARGRELAKYLGGLLGDRFEDMKEYIHEIEKLARAESEMRLTRHYSRVGIGSDFVVKKNGDLSFVEVKVNQSEPKKYQRASFQIAEKYGFKTMILKLSIKIGIQSDIELTKP